ncbi:site-specific integrase [Novosphingobium sp. ES2-1]|uniref:tyrosine-type recombinase/integrase n=1 Tax=Novosphingobium sp. ES2-1 TaxID=2780074 RepID=UPI001E3A1B1B|nr:site-specific integrase [Novosphingobium sp. ES2-1]
MPSQPAEFTVQRFREGFAIVWREDGKRRRRQLASVDRKSAEAEARILWEGADSSPWTVGRCMTSYLATITEKPSYARRQDAWKAMRLFWENVDPALIDEPMCRKYRASRKVGEATARYELMQLSTALGWAAGKGHLSARPKIWLPTPPERKMRHLSRAEFNRFYAAVKADHAKLYVMLGMGTMARPTAILELSWDRIDFARRRIDFTPPEHRRTNKRRTIVPMSDELLVELQKGFAARTCEYVIEHGGERIKCIKKAFQAASERSGVHVTPYTLRHTGAVWAAEAGVPMSELAQFMGHDDDRTTQKHYARFSPDYLMGVANAFKIRA